MLYADYQNPETVEEAVRLLATKNGKCIKPIAGGTDLMIQIKERFLEVHTLLDLNGIEELRKISVIQSKVNLGAAVTYNRLIASEIINRQAFLLSEASYLIGAHQIQNMGTIGGNVANASPAGDAIPCLYALNADVKLVSSTGERILPISEFILGVRRTAIKPNELIKEFSFNALPSNAGSSFVKLGLRQRQAISVVSVAAVLFAENGKISDVRIALGSVAPTIVRGQSAEKILLDQLPSEDLFDRAGEAARKDILPIDDIRGSAAYRTYVTKPLVKEALGKAWRRANSAIIA